MANYHLGKIYKIRCNKTGAEYYGATCAKTLAHRMAAHLNKYKTHSKNNSEGKKAFLPCYEIIEGGDYAISLVESVPCNTKDELNSRLQYFLDNK
jgi:hypothetical protein